MRFDIILGIPSVPKRQASRPKGAKCHDKWVFETNNDTINLEEAAFGFKGLLALRNDFAH